LKAIDYQDATPTNYDYGMLRMECGRNSTGTITNGSTGSKAITFGTAFSKFLAFFAIPEQDTPAKPSADGESTSGITVYIHNDSGVDRNYGFWWVAIGVK